jgi:AmpE protein
VEFLALMVALGVYAYRGDGAPVQHDAWFRSLRGVLADRMSGKGLRIAAIVLPVAVLELVYLWMGGILGGLPEFLLLVVVLVYSLGRGNLSAAVSEYLERWSRGDFQAAHQQLMDDPDASSLEPVENPSALHAAARRRLYYRSFERLYAVVFWFVLGGPAAALAYRLAWLQEDVASPEAAATPDDFPLRDWLEWLPARLLALSFALVGDFDACLRRWRDVFSGSGHASVDVLESCGNAALGLQEGFDAESPEQLVLRGAAEIESVQVLHRRALVVWLVVVAFLVIA